MKTKTIIKLVISSVLGLIIDRAFSITDIIKQAIEPMESGPFLVAAKPLIILCFFLIEISGIYAFINKLSKALNL